MIYKRERGRSSNGSKISMTYSNSQFKIRLSFSSPLFCVQPPKKKCIKILKHTLFTHFFNLRQKKLALALFHYTYMNSNRDIVTTTLVQNPLN